MQAHGLGYQTLKFGKDRAVRIRLIKNLIALQSAHHKSHIGEVLQFPLRSTMPSADRANQLAQMKRLVRMAIEYGQQCATRLTEQAAGGWPALCTHSGYDCTLFGVTMETENDPAED